MAYILLVEDHETVVLYSDSLADKALLADSHGKTYEGRPPQKVVEALSRCLRVWDSTKEGVLEAPTDGDDFMAIHIRVHGVHLGCGVSVQAVLAASQGMS